MEWLKKLIEKHTKDGVVDTENLLKEVNTEFPKHAVPKETYNALAETKKKLDEGIAERDKQLEDLKKIDAEGLKAEIERLQEENKAATEKYEAELKDIQLASAIKLAVAGKVHDEDLVSGLVDKTKLIIGDDGKIVGLDEQIASLKENKAFLFKPVDETNQQQQQQAGFKVGNPPPNNQQTIDTAIAAAFGNLKDK